MEFAPFAARALCALLSDQGRAPRLQAYGRQLLAGRAALQASSEMLSPRPCLPCRSNAFEVGRVTPCVPRSLIRGRRRGDYPPYQVHLSRLTALARYSTASFQQSQQPSSHSSALRDHRRNQAHRPGWKSVSGILSTSLQLSGPVVAGCSSVQAPAYGQHLLPSTKGYADRTFS